MDYSAQKVGSAIVEWLKAEGIKADFRLVPDSDCLDIQIERLPDSDSLDIQIECLQVRLDLTVILALDRPEIMFESVVQQIVRVYGWELHLVLPDGGMRVLWCREAVKETLYLGRVYTRAEMIAAARVALYWPSRVDWNPLTPVSF